MAAIILRRLFRRKKAPPLVCAISLDNDHTHQHTAACFVDFEPLAIVELFQSQGCTACPPIVPDVLAAVAEKPNELLLSYNVTLFNHLGWNDTLASTQWDNRQRAYVQRWARTSLFTPMVVANGIADASGAGGKQEIAELVTSSRAVHANIGWKIYVDATETDVRIDSDRRPDEVGPHDINVAVYEPASQVVKVSKGPNKGKKIKHRNVVQSLTKIGEWTGGTIVVPLPLARSALPPGQEAVVFVQGPSGGPILAAAKI